MILRASYGTLGLIGKVRLRHPQKTAYFLLDGRCVFDCSFCSHARSSKAPSRFLSRITWEEVDVESAVKVDEDPNVKRVCFQVVSYPGYREDLLGVLKLFRRKPVSVSVRAVDLDEIRGYFDAGADRVGLALDAATEELYRVHRGGSLKAQLDLMERASKEFPGRITTHLIVGLGETERDLVRTMKWMKERGIEVALFAFTPIKGTKLENLKRPPLSVYRRVQMARFLIFEKGIDPERFVFDESGKIVDFGVKIEEDFKRAFLTSGCPDCTRPFYNESPSQELYNVHDERLLRSVSLRILFDDKP